MEENKTLSLSDLKNKEKEIYQELQSSTLFKQWEGLRTTINLFEKVNGVTIGAAAKEVDTPSEYDKNLTWAGKTLFALSRLGEGYLENIVDEIYRFDTSIDKVTIYKRVSNIVSKLIGEDKLKIVKTVGRKIKVAIKTK